MTYAPIVVFGFNRPDALKNTIASLLRNEEAKDSDLFVFVDGPREGKVGEVEKVDNRLRKYYKLTEKGTTETVNRLAELEEFIKNMQTIVNPKLSY